MEHNKYMAELVAKYNRYFEIKDTSDGDDLWEDLYIEYGEDMLELLEYYLGMGNDGIIDATEYLRMADDLYSEFFECLDKMGVASFKVDVRKAFGGNAKFFFNAVCNYHVELCKYPDKNDSNYAIFKIVA